MKRIVWTFGLISGAILAAAVLITGLLKDQIPLDRAELIGYTTMVAAFLMVFFGIKSYRDTVLQGKINFGRAFLVGMLITGISCVCYSATWQFVSERMYGDFAAKYAEGVLDKAKAAGATAEQVEAKRVEMAKFQQMYKNPMLKFAMTLVEPLPVGLVIALVSAGVLARRREPESAPTIRVA